jgi:hypothetical protein
MTSVSNIGELTSRWQDQELFVSCLRGAQRVVGSEGAALDCIGSPCPGVKNNATPAAIKLITSATTRRHQIAIGFACDDFALSMDHHPFRSAAITKNSPLRVLVGSVGVMWRVSA